MTLNIGKVMLRLIVFSLITAGLSTQLHAQGITAPTQPLQGPGSNAYLHGSVNSSRLGSGNKEYFIFEPADPTPVSAPVIAFLHGYGGINPQIYGAWIKHLVRRGNIVIYPVYQTSLSGSPSYTQSAEQAIVSAFQELRTGTHVAPDPSRFALVGHSLGGVVAANIANDAFALGLPAPDVLMLVHAADANIKFDAYPQILHSDLRSIPSDILYLGVYGEEDTLAQDIAALKVHDAITHIAPYNREVIKLSSDYHGAPPVMTAHGAPTAIDSSFDSGAAPLLGNSIGIPIPDDATSEVVTALDFYGYWKFLDGLTDTAFYCVNREYALGDTEEQKTLGVWSDGVSVVEGSLTRKDGPIDVTFVTQSVKGGSKSKIKVTFSEPLKQSQDNLDRILLKKGSRSLKVNKKFEDATSVVITPKKKKNKKAAWPSKGTLEVVLSGSLDSSDGSRLDRYYGCTTAIESVKLSFQVKVKKAN